MDVLSIVNHDSHNKTVYIKSTDGTKTYEVSVSYNVFEKRWASYMCTCGGFIMKMAYCKHRKYVDEMMSGYPKPEHDIIHPKIEGHAYRCAICDAINFMIVTPYGFMPDHTMVCLKCGKSYPII